MTKFTIKHRFTDAVLFTCEVPATVPMLVEAMGRISGSFDVSPSGCWLWRFGTTHGHARIAIGGRRVYVHRLICSLAHGPILVSQMACHQCDAPNCINPEHLYIGSRADNARDAVERGRTTRGRSLTVEHRKKVAEAIRGRRHTPETRARIAHSVRLYRARTMEDIKARAAEQAAG